MRKSQLTVLVLLAAALTVFYLARAFCFDPVEGAAVCRTLEDFLDTYFDVPQKYLFWHSIGVGVAYLLFTFPYAEPIRLVRVKDLFSFEIKEGLLFALLVSCVVFFLYVFCGFLCGMSAEGLWLDDFVLLLRAFLYYYAMYLFAASLYCRTGKRVVSAAVVTAANFLLIATVIGISFYILTGVSSAELQNVVYSAYIVLCIVGGTLCLYFESGRLECVGSKE